MKKLISIVAVCMFLAGVVIITSSTSNVQTKVAMDTSPGPLVIVVPTA